MESWFRIFGDEVVEEFGRFRDVLNWQSLENLPDLPNDPEALCRWVYPICLIMTQYNFPEQALCSPHHALAGQAIYAEIHFRSVCNVIATVRFGRLKGKETKALSIAKSLAFPDVSPGYAEQQRRGFRL